MRGRTHWRSHLDHFLGSRGAGAPGGNFTALKPGEYAHPLSESDITDLAHDLAQNPGKFKVILGRIITVLYHRVGPIPSESSRSLDSVYTTDRFKISDFLSSQRSIGN